MIRFDSIGKIRYSPSTLGHAQKWWVVVDCNDQIGKYYRKLFELDCHFCDKLGVPAWKEHITVVRNEEPLKKEFWEKYEGSEISFSCLILPQSNDVYYWLEVECDFLLSLREELGLPKKPEFPLHLTFGNIIGSKS